MAQTIDLGLVTGARDGGDADTLNGKDAKYYLSAQNLLDNSNFLKFIAQDGVSGTHGTVTYAGGRWILSSGTITGTANSNGDGYSAITLNGTIYQKVADAPTTATAAIGMVSGTATIDYANGVVTITSAGGVIAWSALYEGEYTADNLPPYVPKGYAAELMECLRYYQKSPQILHCVASSSGGGKNLYVTLPVFSEMRCTPTVVIERINWVGGQGYEIPGDNLPEYTLNVYSGDKRTMFVHFVFSTPPIQTSGAQTMYIGLRYNLNAEL